jgi:hypothetical protein
MRLMMLRVGLALVAGVVSVAVLATGQASAKKQRRIKVCPSGCDYVTIQDAVNAAPDGAKIVIAPGTYGEFSIPGTNSGLTNVTLVGAGAGETTVGHAVIDSGESVAIRGVTITRAATPRVVDGGGIDNSGTLTLNDSTVTQNAALAGGGILNSGTLMLNDSTVSDNSGRGGGGILNWGTVTLKHSTVSGNGAQVGGGVSNAGTLTLTGSTISGNGADTGGGIYEYSSSPVTLKDSKVSGNTPENCFPQGSVAGCSG